ncbi:MAG: zinc ribbon domain-containing protein [Clostridia bacterium]|nr:zinc ribbon domain-containing protein [Clostridia bacterium]MDD7672503.1 zinc ribbon domain-containing protein [Clostridia bacterium]MDY2928826.1 zinc ribbon domain-containing protein [Clostridiaceae bacterium]
MDEKTTQRAEKLWLTAESAAGAAAQALNTARRQGERLVSKTRQDLKLLDLKNEIDIRMREVGRMIYLAHTGAETDETLLEEKLAAIDGLYGEMARLRALRESQKTTVTCPACGRECARADLFCRTCGTKLK